MNKLTDPNDIVVLKPELSELAKAADYALRTLPWTFNRMMMNTSSRGQNGRGLNIAKGVLGQEMLRRHLTSLGISAPAEEKSHRDDDLFDFHLTIDGELTKFDLKTVNHYTNYPGDARPPFSPEYLMDNANYSGPDWRRFFPMLVPHTQIGQGKECYCFAIGSSIDFRSNPLLGRSGSLIVAYPYGEALPFLSSARLCRAREEAGRGFFIALTYQAAGLLSGDHLNVTLVGEWAGDVTEIPVRLRNGQAVTVGPFSCLAAVSMAAESFENFQGHIDLQVVENLFTEVIRNTTRQNINTSPREKLTYVKSDFTNLYLPDDYTLFVLGWLTKDEFRSRCEAYTGYVWPKDSVSRFENQAWSQITESDRKSIERAGFGHCISTKPSQVNAGWLKTNGQGGGACSYIYPNIGRNGGVMETNLYVLPQDLWTISSLRGS